MITINLLPYHLRPIKRSPLPYIGAYAILALTVIIIAGIGLSTQSQISQTRDRLARNQEELDSLKDTVAEYNRLTEQKVFLADKISIINEIVSDRIIWSRQLWNINRLTPENFWFTTVAEKEKPIQVTRQVYNEQTKKYETRTESAKQRVLALGGYVIDGPDGNNDTYPLTFNLDQDPEFASLFKITLIPKVWNTELEGFKVREFSLEYRIAVRGAKGS